MRYKKYADGEWFFPNHGAFKHRCCDCGVVYVLEFDIEPDVSGDHRIKMRGRRDNRATAAIRRGKKLRLLP